jgi:hypothetical protein
LETLRALSPAHGSLTDAAYTRPSVRRSLLAFLLVAIALAVVSPLRSGSPTAKAADSSVYAGLGTWISIFATKAFAQPDAVAAAIAARGVKTVYIETSNYSQSADVVRPLQLGQLVDALHSRGLHVVAWYLPGFAKPALDLRRALAAVQFTTSSGGAFDGFALDIESTAVKRPALRTSRALALSQQLRIVLGDSYPLGAIIPSPRGMAIKPAYWPGFPYAQLAGIYDVFLPMVYWTYSTKGPDGAYGYLAWALTLLRAGAGDPNVAIHLVGGTSYKAGLDEEQAFAQLVTNDGHLEGWSLYDWFGTKPAAWKALGAIPQSG